MSVSFCLRKTAIHPRTTMYILVSDDDTCIMCPSPLRVSLLVFLLCSIVFAQGKHIDLCAPATDRPWQRCSSSQKGLYNHLITRAVHQRGPWLALTVSASCIPARGWARDWSVLMAPSRLMTCDSVSRARFTKVIGGGGSMPFPITWSLKAQRITGK